MASLPVVILCHPQPAHITFALDLLPLFPAGLCTAASSARNTLLLPFSSTPCLSQSLLMVPTSALESLPCTMTCHFVLRAVMPAQGAWRVSGCCLLLQLAQEAHSHQEKGRALGTQLLLSYFGFLTQKRGADTLKSKERAEVPQSGCRLWWLEHWRHCWSLGASWRTEHLEPVKAEKASEEG